MYKLKKIAKNENSAKKIVEDFFKEIKFDASPIFIKYSETQCHCGETQAVIYSVDEELSALFKVAICPNCGEE